MGLRTLAARWHWSTKKVNKFLSDLSELGEIDIVARKPVTIINLKHFVHRINKKGNKKETKVLQAVDALDT
jgi:hypothetical protein